MTPNQELLLAAVVLYLLECLIVLPRHALLFWSPGFHRFQIKTLEGLLGSPAKAVFIAMPLPPLGEYYVADPWPFALSPDGVARSSIHHFNHDLPEPGNGPAFHAFADISEVGWNGPDIVVNGTTFTSCGSEPAAERGAKLIRKLADLPKEKRAARIDKAIAATLDVEKARAGLAAIRNASRYIRFSSNVLFLFIFAGCPFVVSQKGLANTWPLLGASLLLLWAFTTSEFWMVHRSLWLERKRERRKHALVFGMTPVGAIRLVDTLRRDAMAEYHPLAIARVACNDATFEDFASRVIRDLAHPLNPVDGPHSTEDEDIHRWFRQRMQSACDTFLTDLEIDTTAILRPPVPIDDSTCAYCPRCHVQYTRIDGDCPNCAGVALRAFVADQPEPGAPPPAPVMAPSGAED